MYFRNKSVLDVTMYNQENSVCKKNQTNWLTREMDVCRTGATVDLSNYYKSLDLPR